MDQPIGEDGARITLRVDVNGNGQFSDSVDLTYTTVVGADGRWRIDLNSTPQSGSLPAGGLADGTYSVIATATNSAPNPSPSTPGSVTVDGTAPPAPVFSAIGSADVVNAAARAAGVIVSGTAEAGSTVAVTWGSTTLTSRAGTDGRFSVTFASTQVPADGATVPVSATATDAAGNT
ncbi:MAG: Ig-like domain-containing protein, partial [Verrucomicrobiota bacterium]